MDRDTAPRSRAARAVIRSAVAALCLVALALPARAEDYTSTNFIVHDPVLSESGGYSASSSFQHFSSDAQPAQGENASTTFIQRSGFLYFPVASLPVVNATAGQNQVDLSWTGSVGTLASVESYDVGVSTTSGGPYTFTAVGNVLAHTFTGLADATQYFFVVRPRSGTAPLATSAQVSTTTLPGTAAPPPVTGGGGGGGGGGGQPASVASLRLNGLTSPSATVTILRDGAQVARVSALNDGVFAASIGGVGAGTFVFSAFVEDVEGRLSSAVPFPVTVGTGITTVSGLVLPPTIAGDRGQVKRGDTLTLVGRTAPGSTVVASVGGIQVATATADANGAYRIACDTSFLADGAYLLSVQAKVGELQSPPSADFGFRVGAVTTPAEPVPAGCPQRGDLRGDCRVNLVDFSILAFWFGKQPLSEAFAAIEKTELNGDGRIDLVDFSLIAFYWTG